MQNNTPDYQIIEIKTVSEELYQACQRLIPQLTKSNPPPTREQLTLMLSGGSSILFSAIQPGRDENSIIGLATLVVYRVPTGLRGYIEDVIVAEEKRGRGVGEALLRACLDRAAQAGCPQVMLTSNPARESANRLYLRLGFEQRQTNVYRYRFSTGSGQESTDPDPGIET